MIGAAPSASCAVATRRFDLALDLLQGAGPDEQVLERGDLVGAEVGGTEPLQQGLVGGFGPRRGERDERRRLAFAQVVADRLAR